MTQWTDGLALAELDEAQARYEVRFPPDMIDMYRQRWPSKAYDWSSDDQRIREMLAWPFERLLWDVEHGSWWADWGERPTDRQSREEIVGQAVAAAPRLIPIYGHRFIPEEPHESGNPVFSMYGFDTIYYGGNLEEYFENEFSGGQKLGGVPRNELSHVDVQALPFVPFWSDLALSWNKRIVVDD